MISREEAVGVGLGIGRAWRCCNLGDFLFECFEREQSSISAVGREKMEAFSCGGCVGFSSITRDFSNRRHSRSMPIADVDEESKEVAGVLGQVIGRNSYGGRRGGGYVVGNA